MTLLLYNTLTGKKEEFKPLEKNKVKMYVCGPTVYNFIHVGNARPLVFFDVVYRYLQFKGYEVTYVRNITDVDDKIIKRAQEEKKTASEISEIYIKAFEEDTRALNLKAPTYSPKATEYIQEMIQWIQTLIAKGYAYEVQGEVLYSIDKIKFYKLSKKNTEELWAGARVEVAGHKKNPGDFVLWKPSKPQEPSWESPWGKGRPGWHIECSVMSTKYLGETLDIHGAGRDLIFPHHENEMIQSESYTGKPFVNVWMHNEMLSFGKEKMSKSLGNIITIHEFLEKYPAEVLKFILLSNHYRSLLEFSEQAIFEAIGNLEKIYKTLSAVQERLKLKSGTQDKIKKEFLEAISNFWVKFEKAMDDDFNTAEALGVIFEVLRRVNRYVSEVEMPGPKGRKLLEEFLKTVKKISHIWGLFSEEPTAFLNQLKEKLIVQSILSKVQIEKLISEREEARKKKDWKRADDIRKELEANKVILEDTSQGTKWKIQT
ncbi:MAG: cysteine--tRNA ligase [Deltaproteobacteria bacterium GWA2_38_16]|nr:MAG: cysteine--tRNA ligase [Deltaproteobacteria bacterium GWA2_38_16]OGQ03812.1 MAG: cysteine--tRNA ligase [Deltaproteobacteria bacterium RIFCSPHIGHO2_02_FULL_38_15]OGQ34294.1 MAG: cysteine--tRNA ligase [Deltaproteobacteria bacterium RIFCSPLOWO2_01_FULL_38_9]OGQ59159.1 MAG: cysteine--tRNA ligase [Deltaproteobacteria bacterium RIFCSPLOWO2_12_FULL_38_8]HBQ20855.1 cysteine--tRNA ligase [Deltaproteobacteria bacterium]